MSWLTDLVNKVKKPGVRNTGTEQTPLNLGNYYSTGAKLPAAWAGAISIDSDPNAPIQTQKSTGMGGIYPNYQNTGVLGESITSAPAQTAPKVSPFLDTVKNKISSLNNIYYQMYGDTEAVTKEQANQLQTDYNANLDELNQGYAKSAEQLGRAYGARGIQDSSYFRTAQDEAGDIYSKSQADLTGQFQSGQARLGQASLNQRNRIDAARNQFNNLDLNQLDEAGLQDLSTQLDTAIADANATRSNFRTQGEYANELNKITPLRQQGTAQLSQKLQTLVTSSAPIFAKKQIAMGLIRAAQLNDPQAESYWRSYFDNLLTGKA